MPPSDSGSDSETELETPDSGVFDASTPCVCAEGPGQFHPLATQADFISLFSRRWLACEPGSVTGFLQGEGLEAHTDGTYAVLVYDSSGNLGPNGETGTYNVVPNGPGVWQINISLGVPTAMVVATVTDSPRMMVMNENAVYLFHYVPLDDTGWPDDAGAACSEAGVAYSPPAECAASPGPTLPITSQSQFTSLLVQPWLLCSAEGGVEEMVAPSQAPDPSQAGVDIRSDGTFNVLVLDATGRLVPGTDIYQAGTWQVEPNPAPNTFQVNFQYPAGEAPLLATFAEGPPLQLMLSSGGRYLPLAADGGGG